MSENLKKFVKIIEKLNSFLVLQENEDQLVVCFKKKFTESINIFPADVCSGYSGNAEKEWPVVFLVNFKETKNGNKDFLIKTFAEKNIPILDLSGFKPTFFKEESVIDKLRSFVKESF
jgi:hypothetical protein